MTLAQLIECVFGKVVSLKGATGDVTPFQSTNPEDIADMLGELGYEKYGTEILYNGRTGEQMEAKIFIGPTFYYRLKHLVAEKVHCLDNTHDVLTTNGWKNITQVTKNDQVATLNPDTNKLSYEYPTNIFHYKDHKGPMYQIKSNNVELSVTTNHKMWVSKLEKDVWQPYKLLQADCILSDTVRYQQSSNNDFNEKHDNMDELYYQIKNNEIKKLPNWIWSVSKKVCQMLINQLENDDEKIITNTQEMLDDLMRLCLHAGWFGIQLQSYNQYVLDVKRSEVFDENYEEKVYHYEGGVYCIEVPNHIFYVRKNGKPVWTGNSRAGGPYQLLTRQPAEGRQKDGGLRLGEMEKDCLLAHGSVGFLKERTFDNSDKFVVYVCKNCGMIAVANDEKEIYYCTYCDNTTDFAKVMMPYAAKLLTQELMSMGTSSRFVTGYK